MCGVSVMISLSNQNISKEHIKEMNDKVSHRGPDDEGFYFEKNFAFGHRRLSIIDLSSAGHQPMQRGSLCITFNGEIYNYIELRDELIKLGHQFKSGSDTEVILAAYQQWGTLSFSKFNGMWAFAIADLSSNEIFFCRDHFGIKPLYFTSTSNFFLAGSEIKQFTAVPDFKPSLNKRVAVNFLLHGLLNYSEETFFEGVNELRPGHFLKYNFESHKIEIEEWYDLDKSSKPVDDNFDTAVEKVRSLFLDSVRIRMRSDVRVGSCLSGGIDSSSIVSAIASQKMANDDFATITSCYTDQRYDEQQYSDLITQQTKFKSSKVFPQLDDLLDKSDLDKMIYHQDQPFSTASHFSEFKVFETARKEKMIVMQDGQGSDEYLCGYPEFFTARLKELLYSFRWIEMMKLINQKSKHKNTTFVNELQSFFQSMLLYSSVEIAKRFLKMELYPWLNKEWQSIAQKSKVSFKGESIRELSISEIKYSSIPYQLHSEDRNSMLFSIESRLPFLDHRLVEYCIGLPSNYKINKAYSKYVLRQAIPELPESIRYRKDKMGFVAPDAIWMLQNKKRVREDLKHIVQSSSIFSEKLLDRFDKFTEGKLGYEPIYFRAMTLSRFCRLFKMSID
jgi:asparagine synthase (glutamine-hydrolysing)